MRIVHDGSTGGINMANGSLTVRVHDSNGKGFYIEDPNGGSSETIAKFEKNSVGGAGRCELMYGGLKRLETTSAGVTINGDLNVTGSSVGTVPSGTIVMYNGNTAPSGWAICNGQNGTPDLRDKFIVGSGSSYNRGDTGGAASVTLTVNQIPSHDHNVDTLNEFASTHGTWQTAGGYRQDHVGGTHRKPITSDTGGGQSHENRPPYYAVTFIMKT